MALTFPFLSLIVLFTRVFFSSWSLASFLGAAIAWRLFIPAEAAFSALLAKKSEPPLPHPRLSYTALVILTVLFAIFPTGGQLTHQTGSGAFRIPSASMCPTICKGERIVADRKAYNNKPPQRGDIVLTTHQLFGELLIKRVIGVPGDLVAPGPENTILVNGSPLPIPQICGTNLRVRDENGNGPSFQPIKIPEGSYFMVGDNLGNSLDSRFPEFGLVPLDQIRGKPLFLYWSPKLSRFGCPIR
ncbi:MAG TPA: signal peptidase I [Candidatus Acidoferrum sp.]|nr:signal peptidase I [Candidatus Acidoferrum sp.]